MEQLEQFTDEQIMVAIGKAEFDKDKVLLASALIERRGGDVNQVSISMLHWNFSPD